MGAGGSTGGPRHRSAGAHGTLLAGNVAITGV